MVSIIIPVYNTGQKLRRCLDSVLAQDYTDWECILVDDGSTDGSSAICDKYAALNLVPSNLEPKIRVIHKQNGGVSSARNAGLEVAQGEWLCFIDSDDYVAPDYLSCMVGTKADMVCCGFHMVDSFEYQLKPHFYDADEIARNLGYLLNNAVMGMPVCKLIRRDLVEQAHLRFDINLRLTEDTLFVNQYLQLCDSIEYVATKAYYYDGVYGGDSRKYILSELEMEYIHRSQVGARLQLREHFPGNEDVVSNVCPRFRNVKDYKITHQASDCYHLWCDCLPADSPRDAIHFYHQVMNVGAVFADTLFDESRVTPATLRTLRHFLNVPPETIAIPSALQWRLFKFLYLHGAFGLLANLVHLVSKIRK